MTDQVEVRQRTAAAFRATLAQVEVLRLQVICDGTPDTPPTRGIREAVAHSNAEDHLDHVMRELREAAHQLHLTPEELGHDPA